MNNFLNEAVKASLPSASGNRIPLSYAHKKERDTFYEVSTNELPPVVQHNLHPRHKPRVRVTTDRGRPGSDRNKDRMSYRHLAYQIDLTQVAIPEVRKSIISNSLEVY